MLPPNSGDLQSSPTTSDHGDGALTPVNAFAPPAVTGGWTPYSVGKPELLTAKPDPVGLLRALRTNWAIALVAASVIGFACFALGWLFIPITYEIQALLEVKNIDPGSDLDDDKRPPTRDEVEAFRETQLAIVKSPSVLNEVLADPSVANLKWVRREPDKVRWLRDNLIVSYMSENADYLRIMMRDEDPAQMQVIVNAVHDAYLKHYNANEWQQKVDRKTLLTRQQQGLLSELSQLRDNMQNVLEGIGSMDDEAAANKERVLASQLASLRQQLTHVSQESRRYQAQAVGWQYQLQRYSDPEKLSMMVDRYLDEEPEVQALAADIRNWQRAIAQEEGLTVRQTAYTTGLRQRLAQYQQDLAELKESLRPAAEAQFRMEMLDQIEAELTTVALAFRNASAFEQETRDQIAEVEIALEEVRQYNTEVAQAEEKIEPLREVKNNLEAKLRQLDLELALGRNNENQRRVRSVYRVSNEEAKLKYRPLANYVLVSFCGVAGFGLTFGGFALSSFYRRRVAAAEQMEEGLDIRVLGVVPQLSSRLQNQLTRKFGDGASAMNEVIADSIDGVRTFLLHAAGANAPRVVMITSANEQEAKTTVASQLAASLARCGRKTLLIDGDLRRPAIGELFDVGETAGLCEVIRGEAAVDDVVIPAPGAEKLHLLPAGRCNRAAIQGLENDEIRGRIFGPLRAKFDYIIIDTAPVLSAADTLSLGQFVDASIISVRRDVSRLPRVYEAYERLRAVGIEVLGSVVSGENSPELRQSGPLLVGETV